MNEIEAIIYQHVGAHYDIEGDDEYTPDVNLFDAGFLDSLGAVELMTFLETRWGIEITQRDLVLYPMNSVREIALVVQSKL